MSQVPYRLRYAARPGLWTCKILEKIGRELTVNTKERVMVLALCTCSHYPLSMCEDVDKKNLSLGLTVQHHLASLVMPNSDPHDGFFCPPLTPMKDTNRLLVIYQVNSFVHVHATNDLVSYWSFVTCWTCIPFGVYRSTNERCL